jgi:hypothetical protein
MPLTANLAPELSNRSSWLLVLNFGHPAERRDQLLAT